MTAAIAWLGMYDHPACHAANDALWDAIVTRLRDAGWDDVPERLSRDLSADQAWSHPRLLLGQICIRPWRERYAHLRPLCHPVYPGTAQPGRHVAQVMVASGSSYQSIDDLKGARVAVNDLGSNTGFSLLEDITGPIDRWAGSVVVTGSHRDSLDALSRGEAEVASIDEISFRMIEKAEPALTGGCRTIARTRSSVTPPLVTGPWLSDGERAFLREVVEALLPHGATDIGEQIVSG